MSVRALARSAFAQAGSAVRGAPLLTGLAVVAVALGVALVGAVDLGARNATSLLRSWGEGVELTLYFDPEAPPGRAAAAAETLRRVEGVDHVRYVTPAEALQRLREGMGSKAPLLDGIADDFLPPSLEVSFQPGRLDSAGALALAERVRRLPGVDDVEAMGDWVQKLRAAAALLRALLLAALALVGAVCVYLCAATIKLGVFARREEIEILKLVGATDRFVRAPFWIEGALEGLVGAGLGLGGLYLAFRGLGPRLETLLGGVLGGVRLSFAPPAHVLGAVAAATLLGLLGSHLAVRRHLHV